MSDKKKATRITTPKGRANWPKLTEPDTKFNADGVYSVKLALGTADAQGVIEVIEAERAKAIEDAKAEAGKGKKVKVADPPYVVDEENDTVTFNFKMKASGKTKAGEVFTQKPALFDAHLNPLPAGVKIGGGSLVRVSADVVPFYTKLIGAGVSLRLRAVQVIELVEFGGDGASYGFEAEEDGFAAEDDTTASADF